LELAEPGGWICNFVDLGAPMTDLLERLVQVQTEHKYAQQILGVFRAEARNKMTSGPETEMCSDLSGRPVHEILTQRETELLPLLA
jgi:hypothetical protein